MKRTLFHLFSILILLSITLSSSALAASNNYNQLLSSVMLSSQSQSGDVISIDSEFLKLLNKSAPALDTNDDTREFFIAFAIIDCKSEWSTKELEWVIDAMMLGSTYAFQDNDTMNAFIFHNGTNLIIKYNTVNEKIHYAFSSIDDHSNSSDFYMKALHSAGKIPIYSSVSGMGVLDMINTISESYKSML